MGFNPLVILPAMRKPVTFIARDEQLVRRRLQGTYHRPAGEAWSRSILRIRARHFRRVSRWLKEGIIDQRIAERMKTCTPPNSGLAKKERRYCEHPSCPYCHYRRTLHTFRTIWHQVCAPELKRRRTQRPKARRDKMRLALGGVLEEVPTREAACARVRELVKDRVVRKIQHAGGISDGVATINIHRRKHDYLVQVFVLGLTEMAVQRSKPQWPRTRGGCDLRTAWAIQWINAVSGYDVPKYGPRSLLRLVRTAMPACVDDTQLRLKRLQPLGSWRQFLRSRPTGFSRPIRYQSNRVRDYGRYGTDQNHERRMARLQRFVTRRFLERLCREADLESHQPNIIIGRFITVWNESTFCPPLDLLQWTADQLGLRMRFVAYHYYMNGVDGFVPPADLGGLAWKCIAARLQTPPNDFPFTTHDGLPSYLIMRPPGKGRGAVVVHQDSDAVRFGRIEAIRGMGMYVQNLDAFLDFVILQWHSRPTGFKGIIDCAV